MNDDEFQQKLRAFSVPAPSDVARERARHRALIAFSQSEAAPAPERWHGGFGWGALAGAAAMALVSVFFWPKQPAPQRGPDNAAVLAQVEALFPGQLDAVIEHDGEVQLALAARARAASDQPLLVEFRRGDSLVRVLSYSGRHVCVDLGGRQACFDALLSDNGQVIVAGEDFVWTAQDRATAGGWQITAAPLGGA